MPQNSSYIDWLLAALLVFTVALRLSFLNISPPGFYIDEAHGAITALCISETGTDADSRPWPLFPKALGGGDWSPTFAYPAAAWVAIFGATPQSMRSYVAAWSLLTLIGLFLLAQALGGTRAGLWAALAGSIMPWGFHLSRVAFDASLVPCFLVWGCYLLFLKDRGWFALIVSGVAFAGAAYSYPGGRVTAPLVAGLALILLLRNGRMRLAELLVFSIAAAVAVTPLGLMMLSGELLGRMRLVSIFAEHHLQSLGRSSGLAIWGELFLENLWKHLSLEFLVLYGDSNMRHSTGFSGMLGALDIAALVALVPWLVFRSVTRLRVENIWRGSWCFALAAAFAGILPAALTWQATPHALRAVAAWPFLALFTGLFWNRLGEASRPLALCGILIAGAYFGPYLNDYLTRLPIRAAASFDIALNREFEAAAGTGSWFEEREKLALITQESDRRYRAVVMRYYMMERGGFSCAASRAISAP